MSKSACDFALSRKEVCFINFAYLFQDVLGVTLGGTLGHALCTGLAVIGGRLIAQKISVKSGKMV